jgi:hypothetical protein
LRDVYRGDGRKSDPAEHSIASVTRRRHPDIYARYRRAKKKLDGLSLRLQAKRAALSGRQSELAALRDEFQAVQGGRRG